MCGIAGIVWPGKSPIPFVQTALEMQRHRGPDGEGQLVVGDTALVHSRLSILDLKGGQQPMESARFAVVFNGEIYNYLELKMECLWHLLNNKELNASEIFLRSTIFIETITKYKKTKSICIPIKSLLLTKSKESYLNL